MTYATIPLPRRACVSLLLFCVWAAGVNARAADSASSATAPHLRVELVAQPPAVGGLAQSNPRELRLGLLFHLDKGWHIYWSNAGDSGEPPSVQWHLPKGFSADPMEFPVPRRLPLGPLMDYGYEDQVLFPMWVDTPAEHASDYFTPTAHPATLNAEVSWLVCRQSCIPGKAALALSLPIDPGTEQQRAAMQALFARTAAEIPWPRRSSPESFTDNGKEFVLRVHGPRAANAVFFPFSPGVIKNAAPQHVRVLPDGIEIRLTRDDDLHRSPGNLRGVLAVPGGAPVMVLADPATALPTAAEKHGSAGIVRAIGFALIGGVILNLMPCVFPVLFLKALTLLQSSGEERRHMRAHGLVYTLGILVSFWAVVALLLALRAGGRHLGWGFQFQSPSFVAAIAMLLFLLGLSLAGMFEIGLSVTSAGSALANRQGYAGSFFTGVLAMVVATPCTAPFMGAAIGFALAQSAGITFAIFTALGLGLALPYLALAFQPAWTRLLPRPGAWMEILKQAIAIPVFGTVIWMVWLFAQSAGVNALPGLLAAFLLLAVAAWILGRWPARRPAGAAAMAIIAVGAALPISAAHTAAPAYATASPGHNQAAALRWEAFTPGAIAKHQAEGRPVFVDFTASWCLSCQVNERLVLNRSDVGAKLAAANVALVRADWTQHDETIGRALEALGRNGVPAYALYPGVAGAPPRLLPEVLTTGAMMAALDDVHGPASEPVQRASREIQERRQNPK